MAADHTPRTLNQVSQAARRCRLQQLLVNARLAGWGHEIEGPNDEAAVLEGCYFDERWAQHVLGFFQQFLVHTKQPWVGQPFVPLPWQATAMRRLFGWRRANGTRRFRRGLIATPKKAGKSTWLAGLGHYLLMADGEFGAEVYTCAADRAQASIIWNEAWNMARLSPALGRHLKPIRSTKVILFEKTGSVFQALSAEAATKEGYNAHGVLFDELHAQKNSDLWDTMYYAIAARQQGLHLAITTAGWDQRSICWEVWRHTQQVLAGDVINTAYFGLIYAADAKDDWLDPAVHAKANPSLGVTFSAEDLMAEAQEAQGNPRAENKFKRYRLNIWTQQQTRWITGPTWRTGRNAEPFSQGELDQLLGRQCYAGLDIAAVSDLTALALVFPTVAESLSVEETRYDALWWYWMPEDVLADREREHQVPYRQWVADGLIQATPGDTTNYAAVRATIARVARQYKIREIAIDTNFQGLELAQHLAGEGLRVVEHGQSFKAYAGPCNEFYKAVATGRLRHGGNEVTNWMAANIEVEQNHEGLWKPKKPDRQVNAFKIDGIVAAIMALSQAQRAATKRSVYERRGIRSV